MLNFKWSGCTGRGKEISVAKVVNILRQHVQLSSGFEMHEAVGRVLREVLVD